MKAVLSRTYNPSETLGSLFLFNGHERTFDCKTIELPWLNNQKNCSCIPEGIYEVIKYESDKHGKCFKILHVPGRTDILIHPGNYVAGENKDSLGCILPGIYFTDINDDRFIDVAESSRAMQKLLMLLPDYFKIMII